MSMYKKEIVNYNGSEKYIILVPVFYECESKPAWRNVFSGSLDDCKKAFSDFPDCLSATDDENKKNRYYMRLTAEFWEKIGRRKAAAALRSRYGF